MTTLTYPRPSLRQRLLHTAGILLFIAVVSWAWRGSDFAFGKLTMGLPRMAEFFGRMLPPNIEVTATVLQATVETIQIALLGTVLSAVASFFLGVLAATNLTPKWIHQPVRWLLSVLRAIPMILLALVFVSTVGLGPFPGVLTVAV
ncbi:MAG: hypothetical protein KDE31_38340, partial [Caldilineaceae bacterium]|nr:hypothetical protein [Caldilineaceae bacterium]